LSDLNGEPTSEGTLEKFLMEKNTVLKFHNKFKYVLKITIGVRLKLERVYVFFAEKNGIVESPS